MAQEAITYDEEGSTQKAIAGYDRCIRELEKALQKMEPSKRGQFIALITRYQDRMFSLMKTRDTTFSDESLNETQRNASPSDHLQSITQKPPFCIFIDNLKELFVMRINILVIQITWRKYLIYIPIPVANSVQLQEGSLRKQNTFTGQTAELTQSQRKDNFSALRCNGPESLIISTVYFN